MGGSRAVPRWLRQAGHLASRYHARLTQECEPEPWPQAWSKQHIGPGSAPAAQLTGSHPLEATRWASAGPATTLNFKLECPPPRAGEVRGLGNPF